MIANYTCGHCGREWSRKARAGFTPKYCSKSCRYDAAKKTDEEKLVVKNACKKRWTEANRDRINASQKAWRDANKDKVKAHKRAELEKFGSEYIAERLRQSRLANIEKYRERERAYYKLNAEKICARERAWRSENPEVIRKRNQSQWRDARWLNMLSRVQRANKAMGASCDLTHEWFRSRLEAGICEMSGLPFDMTSKRGPNAPSIDRIRPGEPYSQDNCRMVLWSVNHALSNYGEDYVLGVFSAILERRRLQDAA